MLEQCFKLPAILRGHRDGLLGPYLDSFTAELAGLGYARQTVRSQCRGIRDLGLWLERNGLGVIDLSEAVVDEYLEDRRRRGGISSKGGAVFRLLVEHLRHLGVVALPKPLGTESGLQRLVRRYIEHLAVERRIVAATIEIYVVLADSLIRLCGKPIVMVKTTENRGFRHLLS